MVCSFECLTKVGDSLKWTDSEHNYLIDLIQQFGKSWQLIADSMSEKFDKEFTSEQCRARYLRNKFKKTNEPTEQEKYGKKEKFNDDGSVDVDQLIKIAKEQLKDDEYILKAHGYDPKKWEITSHQFSMWHHRNKETGTIPLYASKIKLAPKQHKFDEERILKFIEKIPSINIPKVISKEPILMPYLNIPLFDMHFGISNYQHYKPTQQRILHYLEQPRKDVLFIIGQDLFHNDDFRGRTSSGREIQRVDMEKAEEDAWKFYAPLIEKAIERSKRVHIYYSIGNHDEASGWWFVKSLEKRYEGQVIFDTRFKERKVHMLGSNFVGMNHSDKKKITKLSENFSTEFPIEWSKATTREVFVGHLHAEEVYVVKDSGGLVMRRMPTGNMIDDWHDSHGYTTAHKRFQILEYSEDKVMDIHYV